MTSTEIRETLTEVGHAVEVPPVDALAFQARVRVERRRRTAGRSVLAGAAAAAVAVAAVAVTSTGGTDHRSTGVAGSPVASPPLVLGTDVVPVLASGGLQMLLPQDASFRPGGTVEEVLGATDGGVVVIDRESRVLLVDARETSSSRPDRELADGEPVQRAWVDKTGEYLGFVDLDNRFHLRRVTGDRDLRPAQALGEQTQLSAVSETAWVELEGDRVTLRSPDASVEVAVHGVPLAAELGGDTLAVHTATGIEFYAAADGSRRFGNQAGSTGSLSPDGASYAYARDDSGRDGGTRPGVFVTDTAAGDHEQGFTGYPDAATALALAWQDDNLFVVLASSAEGPGRVLYECSVAESACEERYDDPTGTLQVASR
jgi:hypothetical protein